MTSPLQNHTLCEHKESTFWNGQVLQTSPPPMDKRTKAPHRAFYTLGCGLLFGLGSFLFSFLVPLLGVFLLFIYLLMWYFLTHHARTPHFTRDVPLEWPIPMFGPPLDSWLSLLLLALAMSMPLWALPTVIMVSKHVITRRWQMGRYFITYYARHPTFSQKGGRQKEYSSCPCHSSREINGKEHR
jgi:hypothetical protein